jgi:hypothetical protein
MAAVQPEPLLRALITNNNNMAVPFPVLLENTYKQNVLFMKIPVIKLQWQFPHAQ